PIVVKAQDAFWEGCRFRYRSSSECSGFDRGARAVGVSDLEWVGRVAREGWVQVGFQVERAGGRKGCQRGRRRHLDGRLRRRVDAHGLLDLHEPAVLTLLDMLDLPHVMGLAVLSLWMLENVLLGLGDPARS